MFICFMLFRCSSEDVSATRHRYDYSSSVRQLVPPVPTDPMSDMIMRLEPKSTIRLPI